MKKALLVLPILAIAACDAQAQRSDTEIESLVKDYILENPEVIIESIENFQKKQFAEELKKSSEQLKEVLPIIESTGPFIGPADAKNVVIEFFDYNCGYCKRSLANVSKLHAENKDVKVIFKELPILSPNSEILARAALAVHNKQPSKYFEFHAALMSNKGQTSKATLVSIANKIGLTGVDFDKDLNSPEIDKEIEANRKLSGQVGIQGTPAFIINGELVRGAVPYEELKAKISK